jgi:hypothetical protein
MCNCFGVQLLISEIYTTIDMFCISIVQSILTKANTLVHVAGRGVAWERHDLILFLGALQERCL